MSDPVSHIAATSWLQPSTATTDRSDHWVWARDHGVLVPAAALCEALQQNPSSVVVLDVRDDDAQGGHVCGSWHWPDSTFDARLDELVGMLRQATARGCQQVVLHCMESVRRGPRCCHKLRDRLAVEHSRGPTALPLPDAVGVLYGGADQWIRQHWRTPSLVADFDPDFWGFGDATDVADSETSRSVPTHILYTRPVDQLHGCDGGLDSNSNSNSHAANSPAGPSAPAPQALAHP